MARGIAPSLILSGQHPGLDLRGYGLSEYRSINLGCPGEQDPHAHVRRVKAAIGAELQDRPSLLVVQGDTSSALGAALAGFSAGIPVAHVEAGLRTHDPALPWPEEEYRTAIDAQADLLFAPTEIAATNLRLEDVPGSIHLTGNTGIDALVEIEKSLPAPEVRRSSQKALLATCHRRESWGEGMQSIADSLVQLARRDDVQIDVVQHPNPHVRRSLTKLLQGQTRITLIPPCDYHEIIGRVRSADLVLSDSGGIQEEAPALGTPLLVLRDKTERPEGIFTGNVRLVGTSTHTIVRAAKRLLDNPIELARMGRRSLPYGDGSAGPRIAELIDAWLGEREMLRGRSRGMSRSEAKNFCNRNSLIFRDLIHLAAVAAAA